MPHPSSIPQLRTPGVMATELGSSLSRVQYILRTRLHIQPTALAGRMRLYDRDAVAMVRYEMNAIDARMGQSADQNRNVSIFDRAKSDGDAKDEN